ncbi:hypothetical protein PSPO01_16022 [Paraphaeosphaeria sporulosa]
MTDQPAPTKPLGGNSSSTSKLASSTRIYASQLLEQADVPLQDSIDRGILDSESQDAQEISQDAFEPTKTGNQEVRRVHYYLGINSQVVEVSVIPPENITTKAVKYFLEGTGQLLYFWSHGEALELVRSVYHHQGSSRPIHAADVFAMAAIGTICDREDSSTLFNGDFLEIFVYILSSPLRLSDLQRMRLFTCLAVCHFAENTKGARNLMSSALGIGRLKFATPSFKAETSEKDLIRWWKVFHSVMFLESWFAYNTGNESQITIDDLILNRSFLPAAKSGAGIFHERMFELGRLVTYAAIDLNTWSKPKATHARRYLDTINRWHRVLPPPMQFSRLSRADLLTMERYTLRSALRMHMLFLAMFIEPYKQCLIDLGSFRLGEMPIEDEDLEALRSVEEQSVTAARQSARVAALLHTETWFALTVGFLCTCTSSVSCAVLLYASSQKLFRGLHTEVCLELAYASSHMEFLSSCSHDNENVKRICTKLQIMSNEIREEAASRAMENVRKSGTSTHTSYSQSQISEPPKDTERNVADIARRAIGLLGEIMFS